MRLTKCRVHGIVSKDSDPEFASVLHDVVHNKIGDWRELLACCNLYIW
jgi:hypothetical protein